MVFIYPLLSGGIAAHAQFKTPQSHSQVSSVSHSLKKGQGAGWKKALPEYCFSGAKKQNTKSIY